MDMEARFLPAARALRTGDVAGLRRLLDEDPELASSRSSQSHPTLLQCLVLEGGELPAHTQRELARLLIEAGSTIDEQLVACGSNGNVVLAGYLLDRGAPLDGRPELLRGWTVLEESIYWGFRELSAMLLERGASVRNLRTAAGLANVREMRRFFDEQDRLRLPEAGRINWPFGKFPPEQESNAPQDLLDNALVYAAMSQSLKAVRFLLDRGASLASFPLGFHYRGTCLHWAAVRGDAVMCELLVAMGADPNARDQTRELTPAQWARHGDHDEVVRLLEARVRTG